jgi:hypothetical protein
MSDKLYHMGIRGKISRSTLADADESAFTVTLPKPLSHRRKSFMPVMTLGFN